MDGSDKRTRRTDENVLATYYREINRIPLLSRAEEDSLARRAKRGDRLAREKLIQANLRFVVNVAKNFHTRSLPFEDLVSEGNVGLVMALERFDPEKGYRFISYAVWWIRQTILRAICEKSRMIRLPLHKAYELLQILKVREDLQGGEMCSKSEAETIARRLHTDSDSVAELLNISRDLLSLQSPAGFENDFSPLEDFVEDKRSSQPEEILIEGSLRDDINRVLRFLTQRESEVLQCRFGLNGKGSSTLRAVGGKYKLTKERIRQIEKKAIKHLRHPSRSRLLRTYY
ncbi:MAG: RNA polymerase sigma factor RpoD/SigA [Spirochaetia bacterium]